MRVSYQLCKKFIQDQRVNRSCYFVRNVLNQYFKNTFFPLTTISESIWNFDGCRYVLIWIMILVKMIMTCIELRWIYALIRTRLWLLHARKEFIKILVYVINLVHNHLFLINIRCNEFLLRLVHFTENSCYHQPNINRKYWS